MIKYLLNFLLGNTSFISIKQSIYFSINNTFHLRYDDTDCQLCLVEVSPSCRKYGKWCWYREFQERQYQFD